MKLCLGTAQFGSNYGISNKNGILRLNEISKILKFFRDKKINFYDTANSYESSKYILSKTLNKKQKKNIITKINIKKRYKESFIRTYVLNLVSNLKVKQIYAILIHNPKNITKKNLKLLLKDIKFLKEKNYIKYFGVSLDSQNDVNFEFFEEFDVIQFPLNIFDQETFTESFLKRLKRKKKILMVRSILLQGLIFLDELSISNLFGYLPSQIKKFKTKTNYSNKVALNLAIDFIKSRKKYLDFVVVGCTNVNELNEIYNNFKLKKKKVNFSEYKIKKKEIIKPHKWKTFQQ